jgi:malate synthase
LQDGRKIDVALCDRIIDEELAKAKQAGDAARYAAYEESAQLMRDLIRSPQFVEFLTVPAYQKILSEGS